MRLKKLEITGFKSFLEKTKIVFPPGITAVVGPNGCGKSNVVDAIRWVMGEQSVKQLRGKSMEDVIFAGADGKKPLNMAEVSLLVENNAGTAPEELNEFTEIMITRRLYRSGETSYLINRQPCRLKDIHNLFLGSGTGKNSFAVIQQGNIGALTDATPEERRFFIEDAADITKFKSRKKETLQKIKTTRENLLRISDIVSEINRQINTLNRQAAKAKKFKEFRERIKKLDITIALWYFEDYTEKISGKDEALTKLKDHEISKTTEVSRLEAESEEIRLQSLKKKNRVSDLTNRHYDLQREIDKKENDLSHMKQTLVRLGQDIKDDETKSSELSKRNAEIEREISELKHGNVSLDEEILHAKKQLEKIDSESQSLRNGLSRLENELKDLNKHHMVLAGNHAKYNSVLDNTLKRNEDITRRLKRTDEDVVTSRKKVSESHRRQKEVLSELEELNIYVRELREEISTSQKRLTDKKSELKGHRETLRALEIENSGLASKYSTLKKMQDNYEWYKGGVKAVMKQASFLDPHAGTPQASVKGILADIVTPLKGYEIAVEAALGEVLQYVLTDTYHTGADFIQHLKENKKGNAGFIPLSNLVVSESIKTPDHLTQLTDVMTVESAYQPVIHSLFGHIAVADDLEQALSLNGNGNPPVAVVTRTGEVVTEAGLLTGGSSDNKSSVLAKKQEIEELETHIKTFETKLTDAQRLSSAVETDVSALSELHTRQSEELSDTEKERMEVEKSHYKAEEEYKNSVKRLEIVSLEQEQLTGEQEDIDDEITRCRGRLEEVELEIKKSEESAATTNTTIELHAKKLEHFNQLSVEHKLTISTLQAKSENYYNSLNRLEDFLNEGKKRHSRIKADIKENRSAVTANETSITENTSELQQNYTTLKKVAEELDANKNDYHDIEVLLEKHQQDIDVIKKDLSKTSMSIKDLEISLSELRLKREGITERIEEKYHHRINQYKLEFDEHDDNEFISDHTNIWVLEAELEELNANIKKLGNVNLGAISEYEELKTRYDFMVKQQEDLENTLDDLEKIIHKINTVSQERFIKTFNEINEKLGELFPKLFEGGSAKMILTEPSNPLETGVELMIQPPGKKLTRLSLLSGGEKALSAIAFVFSIFMIKPASFCIMDEIDAPLDDANVMRFNNLVKLIGEKSQILVITHNKLTMEFADILFGVTMEKRGVSKIVSVNLTKDGSVSDNVNAVA